MKTRAQKWGNSLGIRIPKPYADEMGLHPGSSLELTMKEGALISTPVKEPRWSLEELLAGVDERNIHREWDTGPTEGGEIW